MTLSERIDHEADYIDATPLDTRAKRNVTIKRLQDCADEAVKLEDESASLKRENRRYSAALYDALCLQVEHDDDIFSDIKLDHLMGVALLTGRDTDTTPSNTPASDS